MPSLNFFFVLDSLATCSSETRIDLRWMVRWFEYFDICSLGFMFHHFVHVLCASGIKLPWIKASDLGHSFRCAACISLMRGKNVEFVSCFLWKEWRDWFQNWDCCWPVLIFCSLFFCCSRIRRDWFSLVVFATPVAQRWTGGRWTRSWAHAARGVTEMTDRVPLPSSPASSAAPWLSSRTFSPDCPAL